MNMNVNSADRFLSKAVQTTTGSGILVLPISSAVRDFVSRAISIWVSILAVPCAHGLKRHHNVKKQLQYWENNNYYCSITVNSTRGEGKNQHHHITKSTHHHPVKHAITRTTKPPPSQHTIIIVGQHTVTTGIGQYTITASRLTRQHYK